MNLLATPFTTTLDGQFAPAPCGTLLSASRRRLKRSSRLALVIPMWAYALRIFAPAIELGSAVLALAAGFFPALRRSNHAGNAVWWSAARLRSIWLPSMDAPASGYSATCARVDDD
jgi:hypothetical protein